jgi:hypothetical protein
LGSRNGRSERGTTYRDFIIIYPFAKTGSERERWRSPEGKGLCQAPNVQVESVEIFKNFSAWLVSSKYKVWIELEYFCNDVDPLWQRSDDEMKRLAIEEISKIGLLHAEDVEDAHVVRVPKAYPAYFGSFDRFHVIREYVDQFKICFWLAGMACISTTIRITRC